MEIRILSPQEIPYASELAKLVYRQSIEPRFPDPKMYHMFESYVDQASLLAMYEGKQIVLWGAFASDQLYGTGAMQTNGQITMLYVLPQFQGRGTGKRLLEEMERYAFSQGGLVRILLNATPAWTAEYFSRRGYKRCKTQRGGAYYAALEKKDHGVRRYKVRRPPAGALLGATIGSLVFLFVICIAYVLLTL